MSDAVTEPVAPDAVDGGPDNQPGSQDSIPRDEHQRILSSRLGRQEKKHARLVADARESAISEYLDEKGLDADEFENLLKSREQKPAAEKEMRGLRSQMGKVEKERDYWKSRAERFEGGTIRAEVMRLASKTLYPEDAADLLERSFMLDEDGKVVLKGANGDPDYDTTPDDFFAGWIAKRKGYQPPTGHPGGGAREPGAPPPAQPVVPGDKASRLAAIQSIVDANKR
jgi:hypothetical protein